MWRSFRSRHALTKRQDRTAQIKPDDILVFVCLRNEMNRLPWFFRHYREMGATHFLVVDNDSTDGSAEFLSNQNDVSLWSTSASYRDSRFGLDWTSWLLMRYGRGHWCLTVDADELLVYAHMGQRSLRDLTHWLEKNGHSALGALMLDLYPHGTLGEPARPIDDDPLTYLQGFDAGPYRIERQAPLRNLWVQGGPRDRTFFANSPDDAPTLNKLPLVRWNRRFAYVNSTHSMLPSRLNLAYDGPGGQTPSAVLLHTKFLPDVVSRSEEDLTRQQHFHTPHNFAAYYNSIQSKPTLWHDDSQTYQGWQQLADMGLLNPGGFV